MTAIRPLTLLAGPGPTCEGDDCLTAVAVAMAVNVDVPVPADGA